MKLFYVTCGIFPVGVATRCKHYTECASLPAIKNPSLPRLGRVELDITARSALRQVD